MTILMDIFLFIVVGSHVLLTNDSLFSEPIGYFARHFVWFLRQKPHIFLFVFISLYTYPIRSVTSPIGMSWPWQKTVRLRNAA